MKSLRLSFHRTQSDRRVRLHPDYLSAQKSDWHFHPSRADDQVQRENDHFRLSCKETDLLAAANPYGSTKLSCEQILTATPKSTIAWSVGLLRSFNPIGAHETGPIGEDSNGIPRRLSFVARVAIGKLPQLNVFWNGDNTRDGASVRDSIHVLQLAKERLCAINDCQNQTGVEAVNLRTANGCSVLQIVKASDERSRTRSSGGGKVTETHASRMHQKRKPFRAGGGV
jgi:UDP-glucose 4-epimerase